MHNVLIDGMNLVYRCYAVYDKQMQLRADCGRPTGMEYGFLLSIKKLRKLFPDSRFTVCWEGAPSTRHKDAQEITQRVSDFRRTILYMLCKSVSIDGYTADDLLHALAMKAMSDSDTATLYTTDRDLLQTIRGDKITAYLPDLNISAQLDEETAYRLFKVRPTLWALFRAVVGDRSDKIAGVPRMPKDWIRSVCREIYRGMSDKYKIISPTDLFALVDSYMATVVQLSSSGLLIHNNRQLICDNFTKINLHGKLDSVELPRFSQTTQMLSQNLAANFECEIHKLGIKSLSAADFA